MNGMWWKYKVKDMGSSRDFSNIDPFFFLVRSTSKNL
jgi:hypothetical protein